MEELIGTLTQTFTELNRRINESRAQRNQQAAHLLAQDSNDLSNLIYGDDPRSRPSSASQIVPLS